MMSEDGSGKPEAEGRVISGKGGVLGTLLNEMNSLKDFEEVGSLFFKER